MPHVWESFLRPEADRGYWRGPRGSGVPQPWSPRSFPGFAALSIYPPRSDKLRRRAELREAHTGFGRACKPWVFYGSGITGVCTK
jgi:hypothetical protein